MAETLNPSLPQYNTGRGCVLVSSVAAGSNAEKAGKVLVGDMICYLGKEPKNMVRVEGCDFDQTYGALSSFMETGQSSITLVLKRLVKRQTMTVTFQYAPTPEEEAAGQKGWTKEVSRLGVMGLGLEISVRG